MNNMPKTLSKAAMGIFLSCVLVEPALACGPSFGPVGTAILLGFLGIVAAFPLCIVVAGFIAALRTRHSGWTAGRTTMLAASLVTEGLIAWAAGTNSILGVFSLAAGFLQIFLIISPSIFPSRGPKLEGKLTVLHDPALFA